MLDRDTLAKEVGTLFQVCAGPALGTELKLSALEDRAAPGGYETFSLMLDGPAEPRLGQGIYELAHPRMGTHAIFIVPVQDLAPGIRYEAVFNRRRA